MNINADLRKDLNTTSSIIVRVFNHSFIGGETLACAKFLHIAQH